MVSLHDFNLRAEASVLKFVVLLAGPLTHGRSINWIKRLQIAEDAAKGLCLTNFNANALFKMIGLNSPSHI